MGWSSKSPNIKFFRNKVGLLTWVQNGTGNTYSPFFLLDFLFLVPRQDTFSTGHLSLSGWSRTLAGLLFCPHHQSHLQGIMMAFSDASKNTLPFLLPFKPLASKRHFKTKNQIMLVTCLTPFKSVDHGPSQPLTWPVKCSIIWLVHGSGLIFLLLTHSALVACYCLGFRNTLRVTLPWASALAVPFS